MLLTHYKVQFYYIIQIFIYRDKEELMIILKD